MESNPYRSGQIRVFSSTWLSYIGYYFCRKTFFVVKADLADGLHLDATGVAHLGSIYHISYAIGQFSSAFFGRALGAKRLLLLGMGLSLLCNVYFGASNSYWTIMLFMCLNGLAQGTGWPSCIGSMGYWFRRKDRGRALGIWATCYQVGSVVAVVFAAYILGAAGWRWSFFGGSVVLLAIWAFVVFVHPSRPEDRGLAPLEDPDDEDSPHDGVRSEKLGWDRNVIRSIAVMGAIYFCIKFLRYALWSWTPFFLNKNFGMSGEAAGYLSTVFDVCGFAGVLFAGFVSDKLFNGRRAFVSFAMLVGMALTFGFMYLYGGASTFLFAVTLGFAGFMLFGPDSLVSGVGAIDVGSQRGALVAAGLINGTGAIGQVFQEEIIGRLYDSHGSDIQVVFVVFVVMAVAAAILSLWLWRIAAAGRSRF